MKKYNVYKVLGIVAILTILLSYFIPQTSISYGTVATGDLNPVSIIDTFSNLITSFNVFISPFLYILIIGVFYGLLKKTGKYDDLVTNVAASFKNKGLFVIVSVLGFGVLTAIFGDILALLVFVPFIISVSRKIGYSKPSSIAMTLGSIILGFSGSLYTNVANQILSTSVDTNILYKIIIALVGLISMIVFILIFDRPSKEEIKKVKSKKTTPILVAFITMLVFIILGVTSWSTYFGYKGFEELFKSITEFKVFKVSLFNSFVGSSINAWGAWQLFDIFVLVAIVSLVIAIVYKIKFNEILEVGAASIKKALPYAFIIIIANVVLINTYTSGWFVTIVKTLAGKNFNLFSGILTSMISGIVYPDYAYGLQFTVTTFIYSITKTKDFYDILAITYQSIYSSMLLVAPTSILVLLGLRYTGVRYIEWLKYIWKYFLIVFAINIIIIGIAFSGFSIPVIVGLVIVVAIVILLIARKMSATTKEITKKETTKKPAKKTSTKKTTKK